MKAYKNLNIKNFPISKYEDTHMRMQNFTLKRLENRTATIDELWFLEHHPVFTLGLAGKEEHILQKSDIPIIKTDRGGQVTYHGPGQLICYFLIDLKRKNYKVKEFVFNIEQAVKDFLISFGIKAHRVENAPGIYVNNAKICSMGLKIKNGCSYHGISFNINMDLTPFSYINPCGFKGLQLVNLKDFVNTFADKINLDPKNITPENIAPLLLPYLAKNLEFDSCCNNKKITTIDDKIDTTIEIEKKTKPDWLKIKASNNKNIKEIKSLLKKNNLCTVCEKAACPNLHECFSKKTATFMIMGSKCTRNCAFCNVVQGKPIPLDIDEPKNIAKTVLKMGLKFVVITSVTRDDLIDAGAAHFAACIKEIRKLNKNIKIEILVPDFKNKVDIAFNTLNYDLPDVFNHNLETVPRLYKEMRKGADYKFSLNLIKQFKEKFPHVHTKSGLMLGLGETISEIKEVIKDLYLHKTDMLTIGQYLQPSPLHAEIIRYVKPSEFKELKEYALKIGFKNVASGPFVRSSYLAEEQANIIDESIK